MILYEALTQRERDAIERWNLQPVGGVDITRIVASIFEPTRVILQPVIVTNGLAGVSINEEGDAV